MSDFSSVVPASADRFQGIKRPYDVAEVERLRGSVPIEHTLAKRGPAGFGSC
jgi:isocitrate lyase